LAVAGPFLVGLARYQRVLAVGAHPDDESFGLGAVLAAFAAQGAAVGILSLTHGEASTLGAAAGLGEVRARELAAAAAVLGVEWVKLLDYPDGKLCRMPLDRLVCEVQSAVAEFDPDALLAFDLGGITGHPDHRRATAAVLAQASASNIPVLAWTLPEAVAAQLNDEFGAAFVGRAREQVDFTIQVDRSRQLAAIARHESQSAHNPVLWRRLELQGDCEWLRYLPRPAG
jgi:LmbE family N-acetylglucosaminyl deacetylase